MAASLHEVFEVEATADHLRALGCTRVALQFPDDLVPQAQAVHMALVEELGSQAMSMVVLADSTFDGSQVDFAAAERAGVDLIVHYGGGQLDVSGPIAVYLVFPRKPIDVAAVAAAIAAVAQDEHGQDEEGSAGRVVAVLYEVGYAHAMDDVRRCLDEGGVAAVVVGRLRRTFPAVQEVLDGAPGVAADPAPAPGARVEGFLVEGLEERGGAVEEGAVLVWVGDEEATLDRILLTRPFAAAFCLPPQPGPGAGARRLAPDTAPRLRRRYYLMQRAKDVQVFGIVVATLSTPRFTDVVTGLQRAIRAAGRRCYTLVMGKLNPAKLANFPDVGMFVLVTAAPSALVDSKEYLAPVVTPHELVLALGGGDDWTGDFTLDYTRLLPRLAAAGQGRPRDAGGEDGPGMSLVTGRIRSGAAPHAAGAPAAVSVAGCSALTMASASWGGAAYLAQRHFQGLDASPAAAPVQPALIRGRVGIARGYQREPGVREGDDATASSLAELAIHEANELNDPAGDAAGPCEG